MVFVLTSAYFFSSRKMCHFSRCSLWGVGSYLDGSFVAFLPTNSLEHTKLYVNEKLFVGFTFSPTRGNFNVASIFLPQGRVIPAAR